MAKYRGTIQDANGNTLYPLCDRFFKGDSITFSNSGLQQYSALWSNTTTLRAVVPLDRPVDSGVTNLNIVSGSEFIIHSNNGYATLSTSNLSSSSVVRIVGGLGIELIFSSAQSIAAANSVATFQPRGSFEITLT